MSSSTRAVLLAGLRAAIADLPPRAFGIRSHAISTEEHAQDLVGALREIAGTHSIHAVIGRPSGLSDIASEKHIEVLDTHAAAARATALRNNDELGDRQLLYFNTESSPGESGLDGLDELTPQALALGYAKTADLPILESLADDERRLVVDRIEDATVDQLAAYATASRKYGSESYALPILGLLPLRISNSTRVESLLRHTGVTLTNQLDRAAATLASLSDGEQAEVESSLQAGGYVGDHHQKTLNEVIALCRAMSRFARGLLDVELNKLCGLNTALLRVLRSGDRIREKLLGSEDTEPDAADPSGSERRCGELEVTVLERDGSEAFNAEIAEVGEDLTEVVLKPADDDQEPLYVRAPRGARFALAAIRGEWGGKAVPGCALRTGDGAALLRGTPIEPTPEYELSASALAAEPEYVQRAIEHFRNRRKELVVEVEGLGSSLPEDARSGLEAYGGLGLLECFPLIVCRRLSALCRDYVDQYAKLIATLAADDHRVSNEVEEWILHLDVAFSIEQQVVSAARLLPLHPLRIARYLAWLQSQVRPPAVPPSLVVTYRVRETLHSADTENCYHRKLTVGPTDSGVRLAAKSGLEQLWTLLSPERLISSLDIELRDLPNAVEAVHALATTAQDLFESDRSVGNWVTLVVRVAHSDKDQRVDIHEIRRSLGPEFDALLNMPAGEGLRLELHAAGGPGAQFRHLIVQGVETPYRNLPADQAGCVSVGFEVEYVPSSSGAIGKIEVRGDRGVEAYRDLLDRLNCSTRQVREPGMASPSLGDTLVRTLVCQGGWPVRPEIRSDLLAYGRSDEDVCVTLADPSALEEAAKQQLNDVLRVPQAQVAEEFRELQAASLALYPCREYLVNLIRRQDDRHLRAARGLLKAFGHARRSRRQNTKSLVVSLDTQEGLQWARAAGFALGKSATRADLLIVEADAELTRVERIRIAELKASESVRNLETKLKSFAKQPLTTRDRIRRVFSQPDVSDQEREALRRLVWLAAGHQYLARQWEKVLRDFDGRIRESRGVEVEPECWLVPDDEWTQDREFSRDIEWPNDRGEQETVRVRYTVIDRPVEAKPAVSSSSGKPGETGKAPSITDAGGDTKPQHEPESAQPTSPTERVDRQVVGNEEQSTVEVLATTPGIEVCVGALISSADQGVHWYPNDTDLVTHFNVGVTGTMGTGKTQLVKSLVAQMIWGAQSNVDGHRPGLLIFDYKGDYGTGSADGFASAIGAQILTPEHLPLNPLHLVRPEKRIDFELQACEFADTLLSIGRRMGDVQREEIITGIRECFANAGIDSRSEETWDKNFPTLADLLAYLQEHDLGQGIPQAILGDLVRLEVFAPEDPGAVAEDLFNDITVIDLRRLAAAPRVIKTVVACFMNAFYANMIKLGEAPLETREIGGRSVSLRQLRRLILVDEADDFMALNLQSLKNTMQQGRSFGCGVILSTQFLKHFEGSDAPLRQLIGTWVMHRMADVKPRDVQGLLGISIGDARETAKKLAGLQKHKAMALGVDAGQHGRQTLWIDGLPFYQLPERDT